MEIAMVWALDGWQDSPKWTHLPRNSCGLQTKPKFKMEMRFARIGPIMPIYGLSLDGPSICRKQVLEKNLFFHLWYAFMRSKLH
jgi:hypothetical protein